MNKTAIFPGSFDPFTKGHEDIVRRALKIFDKIIIAIGVNSEKKGFLSEKSRIALIKKTFCNNNNVEVLSYSGLTADFCKQQNINIILRGLRGCVDFEYETTIGEANRTIFPELETIFIITSPQTSYISSTIVRDIYRNGGNISIFLPNNITNEDFSILTKN